MAQNVSIPSLFFPVAKVFLYSEHSDAKPP